MSNRACLVLSLPLLHTTAHALDVSDKFSLGGIAAVSLQCQRISSAADVADTCEAAAPVQPELSYRPTPSDEFFVKLGFAAGDGINGDSPFVIPPWAAPLEDDVKNVNGRNRDHLLTAWYRHTFSSGSDHRFSATVGIIDATAYLDENAYANDEFTQFMNPALTNGPNVFLPSFDAGAALEWERGRVSLRAVLMDVGENDDGRDYRFYGLQAGYAVQNRFGAGNYRLVVAGGSREFLNPAGTELENRAGALLSADQAFGAVVGGWVRIGSQTDDAAVEYDSIYSGGLDFDGVAWGRPDDNIGVGYAHVDGGSLEIDESQIAETYYRWQLAEAVSLTADLQYQRDEYRTGGGPRGWTFGLRATAEF